jgi:hypothetical protein
VEPRWYPHVMFFVPATEDSKWGANVRGAPIFSTTSDVLPITTFFVLAPKWSDGSLGPYVPVPGCDYGETRNPSPPLTEHSRPPDVVSLNLAESGR